MSHNISVFENLFQEELYKISTRVLVILNSAWDELHDEDKTLLTKILNSVKLDPAAVRIIVRETFSLEDVAVFAPERIIAFGSTFESSVAMYQPIVAGKTSVLLAHTMRELDDSKKKNLWTALRQMFGL